MGGIIEPLSQGRPPSPFSVIGGAIGGAVGGVTQSGRRRPRSQQINDRVVARINPGRPEVPAIRVPETLPTPRGVPRNLPVPAAADAAAQAVMGAVGCPKGFRLNKSSYWLRDGTFVPKGSRCVRIRRRNNLNGQAALRSTRRLVGWVKSSQRIEKAIRDAARKAPGSSSRRSPSKGRLAPGTTIVQN